MVPPYTSTYNDDLLYPTNFRQRGAHQNGQEWTKGDLNFYRTRAVYENAETFFQNPDSFQTSSEIYQAPVPHTFDTDFLAALNPEDAGTPGGQASRLIQHLDEAMTASSTHESAALLRALDFAPNEATIRTGKNFAFRIGREKRHAKADVCIVEGTNPLLIV